MNHIRKLINKFSESGNVPSVSIVMPSYNQSSYIEAAIESIFKQDIDDIELIIADGGSTDGTLQILEHLTGSENHRLKWFSGKDNGVANAVNKALLLTKAPIIGWLNSDDLYEVNAIRNAVQYFQENRDYLMVYGQGKHINETGNIIGDYPTLPPDTDINKFSDGCFICQPTVFFKRKLINDIGLLDEKLQTAFDFDFWIRVFKKYQKQIGFIDNILAYSRLHNDCITVAMRKNIAIEAMQILAKHFDYARSHWLKTYLDEILEFYPHVKDPENLPDEIEYLCDLCRSYITDEEYQQLDQYLTSNSRFSLLRPDAFINVYSDGWSPPVVCLRVRASKTKWKKIKIDCIKHQAEEHKLQISVATPWGDNIVTKFKNAREFSIVISLPETYDLPSYWSFIIKADKYYVPNDISANGDHRKLSYQVNKINLLQ